MNKPIMIMLVGLPASGKSTYAKQLAQQYNAEIFSSDALREELYSDVNNQEHNGELFVELHRRIKNCLKSGKSAIYDATNISSKRRKSFVQELNKIDCYKKCVIIATPYEKCLENNKNRDRQVPEDVIERMYKNWNTPYWFENWDDIQIHYYDNKREDVIAWVNEHKDYQQDNPHHTLTLGEHCEKASMLIPDLIRYSASYRRTMIFAMLIHDCGKPFCKKFENSKGEQTDTAHFYSHENVGAYNSLFFKYPCGVKPIDVSILVNLHMKPYYFEKDGGNEKLRNKYKELWGAMLYRVVMRLHEADKAAH